MGTLIWAGLTISDADTPAQHDTAVYVDGNHIVAAGSRGELSARFPDAERIGGHELLMLPAFVNSHDHGRGLGSAALGVPDDLLEIWLPGLYAQPYIDPYLAAAYDGLRLLSAGVGTVAHSHNPRDWRAMSQEAAATLRGYRDAGIRVAFHPPLVDQNQLVYDGHAAFLAGLPPSVRELAEPFLNAAPLDHTAYFALCNELYASAHDVDQYLVQVHISPAGGQWCSDELIVAAVAWARQHATRVQMHMLETRYQREYAWRRWNTSFVRHLDAIGALGPWLTLAHMVWVEDDDLPLLAERGVGIAHNPGSNLRLRSGVAPVAAMLEAGVRLGIGLDGHGLDDDQDYLREMRLAWVLSNRPGAVSPTVPPETILRMATSGGAGITLGDGAQLGRIAPGYLADIVLIDWDAARGAWLAPQVDPRAALLQRAQRQHVAHVMINGRWVVRNRRSVTLDERAIVAELCSNLQQQAAVRQQAAAAAQTLAPYLRRFYAQWDTQAPARKR